MSTTSRGYGTPHQRERARLTRQMAEQGYLICMERVCLENTRLIPPVMAWDLAHGQTRTEYLGPAHTRCNRTEGARRGGLAVAAKKRMRTVRRVIRSW